MRSTLFTIPFINLDVPAFGVMMMLGVVCGVWWASKRAERVKCDGELVVNLGLLILLSSIAGARLFYVIHYWEKFKGGSFFDMINVRNGGLEFYGGFISGLLAIFIYFRIRKLSLRLYFDILAPSVALGMAFGRLGCFLHGCCWGSACSPDLAWAVRFPYESPPFSRQWDNRLATLPADLIYVFDDPGEDYGLAAPSFLAHPDTPLYLRKLAATHRSAPVHPSQIYASIGGFILAVLLHNYFFRRKRHGMVFAMLLVLYPMMRFFEEAIRGDNPHDTLHLTVSQFISIALLVSGVVMMLVLRRMPARSPYADVVPVREDSPQSTQRARTARKPV